MDYAVMTNLRLKDFIQYDGTEELYLKSSDSNC